MKRWSATLLAMLAWAIALAGPAWAQESTTAQQSKENLVSELRGIRPAVPGLQLEVLDRDRFLRLVNATDGQVLVVGYDDEPYLRFNADGRVEENQRSPSKYVNEDRFGQRPVPPQANSSAPPRWEVVSTNGSHRWFDHRIHYMAPGTPEEVTDESQRTKIFDWTVPMRASGEPVRALGTLTWEPDEDSGGSSPVPFIVAGAGLAAIVGAVVLLLRRRRRAPAAPGAKPAREAW